MDTIISMNIVNKDRLINLKKYFRNILLGISLYVFFSLLASFSLSRYLFFCLALVAAVFVIKWPWVGLINIVSLIILQAPFPAFRGESFDLGYNWFTIDLLGVSLIHWLVAGTSITIFFTIMMRGICLSRRSAQAIFLLLGLFSFEFLFGLFWKLNWYRYFVDMAILMYGIVFFFIGIISPKWVREKFIFLLLFVLPHALAWGSIFKYIISQCWPSFTSSIDTVGIYIIVSLLLNMFILSNFIVYPLFKWFNMITLLIFLFIDISTKGTFFLIATGISIIIIMFYWKGNLTRTSLKVISICILLILMVGFSLSYYKEINPVTRMKIEQMTTLFTSRGDPDLMRHSTAVRSIEIINTWTELQDNLLTLTFGKGAGGYFTDRNYPFPYLNESDYSLQERKDHTFYGSHNSPGYILLKNGLLGIMIWLLMIIIITLDIILKGRDNPLKFSLGLLFVINLAIVYGWGVKNSLLIGLFGGLYVSYTWKDNRINNKRETVENIRKINKRIARI